MSKEFFVESELEEKRRDQMRFEITERLVKNNNDMQKEYKYSEDQVKKFYDILGARTFKIPLVLRFLFKLNDKHIFQILQPINLKELLDKELLEFLMLGNILEDFNGRLLYNGYNVFFNPNETDECHCSLFISLIRVKYVEKSGLKNLNFLMLDH